MNIPHRGEILMRLLMIEDNLPLLESIMQLLSDELEEKTFSNGDAISKLLVLFLSEGDLFKNRVTGLEIVSDDLAKPLQAAEIKDHIHALLRKREESANKAIQYHGIQLLGREQDLLVEGNPIKLTAKQYRLLEYLIQNKGAILSKEQIYNHVWGFDSDTEITIVEVFIHHLRKKLEPFGYHTEIKTIRGAGYMLTDK